MAKKKKDATPSEHKIAKPKPLSKMAAQHRDPAEDEREARRATREAAAMKVANERTALERVKAAATAVKAAVVEAKGAVVEAATTVADAAEKHVVKPVAKAVGVVKVKPPKKRFVRPKAEPKAEKPDTPAAPLPPRSTKLTARLMSKGLAVPPADKPADRLGGKGR